MGTDDEQDTSTIIDGFKGRMDSPVDGNNQRNPVDLVSNSRWSNTILKGAKMKTKVMHTPGPWKFEGVSIWGGDRQCSQVAELKGGYRVPNHLESDLKLIAAAPDLLEVARELQEYIGNMNLSHTDDMNEKYDNLCKAIKKAEGE